MTYCRWCKEPLRYIRGKGWVHEDGNVYVTILEYDEYLGRMVERDDHCALPVFGEVRDSTLGIEMENRIFDEGCGNFRG